MRRIILIFFFHGFLENSSSFVLEDDMFPPGLSRNVEEILNIFKMPENKMVNGVQELIDIYHKAKNEKILFEKSGNFKKYPLIVLEGLAGSGKTTVSTELANKINGTRVHSPIADVQKLRNNCINDTTLDNAYHQLGHYITALEIYLHLDKKPVVLDRFWYSSATYYIARAILNNPEKYSMPSKEAKVYKWPADLLKPDIVLFLQVDEKLRLQRINGRYIEEGVTKGKRLFEKNEDLLKNLPNYRNDVLQAYKNMQDPQITVVNDNLPLAEVIEEAYQKVKPFLEKKL